MNILLERYQLHSRQQRHDESLEDYTDDICRLVAACQYDGKVDYLIRDYVLFGLTNKDVAMQIILNGGNPSLSEVIEIYAALCSGAIQIDHGNEEESYDTAIKYIEGDLLDADFQDAMGAVKNEPHDSDDAPIQATADFTHPDDELLLEFGDTVNDSTFDDDFMNIENIHDSPILFDIKDVMTVESIPDTLSPFDLIEHEEAPCESPELSNSYTDRLRGKRQSPTKKRTVEKTDQKKRNKRISTKTFSCNECEYTTNENYLLKLHMYRHSSEKTLPCPKCEMLFKNNVHLRAHLKNKHTSSRAVSCHYCNKVVKNQQILNNHVSTMHPETLDGHGLRKYECYICHKSFLAETSLRRHVYEHTRENRFLCTQCGISKRSEKELERHMLREDHNLDGQLVKPFGCKYCDKRFATKCQLETHVPIHTGEKAFACPLCGKRFANRNNLYQHKLCHMERRHKCTFCEHKCRSKGNLRKHMRIHVQH